MNTEDGRGGRGGRGGLGTTFAGVRSKITRSEYDDGIVRGNVRIDNKYHRELRVHERAKYVVGRSIDKETQMFKQKQSVQRTKLAALNSQGHRIRKSSIITASTDVTNWIHNFQVIALGQEVIPPIQDEAPPSSPPPLPEYVTKSPVSFMTPRSEVAPYHYGHVNNSDDLPKIQPSRTGNGHIASEMVHKPEIELADMGKKREPTESTRIVIPHRQLIRASNIEHLRLDDHGFKQRQRRARSAARGMYMDDIGRVREETVFDFLSKPKYNHELEKRKDVRFRLEKEFARSKPENTTLAIAQNSTSKKPFR